MLGYPGAGKTTVSKIIHELTGAVHLWADHIRRERYHPPSYTHQENIELYDHLNTLTAELLAANNSVIFDTNFNFFKDRERLRQIAKQHGANTIVVWVTTTKDLSRKRATEDAHMQENRVLGDIPVETFERMSRNLEDPRKNEDTIKIEGVDVTTEIVKQKLGL